MKTARLRFGMLAVLAAVLAGPLQAQKDEAISLPDRIVLKADALLPAGVAAREFQGYVVEETPDAYRIETSARRGISAVVTVLKSSVETLERGDASAREYQLLKPKLERARVSQEARVYREQFLKPVDAYLARFPQSGHVAELRAFRAEVEKEIAQVENGWFRIGDYWFQPDRLPASLLPDWKLFLSLRDEGLRMPFPELERSVQKVTSAMGSFLYPQMVVMTRDLLARRMETTRQYLTAAQIDKDAANVRDLEKQLSDEDALLRRLKALDVEEKIRGLDHLQQAKDALGRDPVDLEAFKRAYQSSKEYWPDLKDRETFLLAVLRERAKQLQEAYSDATLDATVTGTAALAQVVELLRDKDEKFQKELADLEKKAKSRGYELQLEKLVAQGNLREALAVFGKLKSIGTYSSSELARMEKDLTALEYENTKAEIARLKQAGDVSKMFIAIEQANEFVKSRQADAQASQYLGLEAAGLSKDLASKFKLYAAAEAAFLAHKIAPEETQVRTVYWAAWAALGTCAMVLLVVVLLLYTSFDNLIHQWRYRLRLKALREDDKVRNAKRRKGIKRSK
jgi:hypothetical protein